MYLLILIVLFSLLNKRDEDQISVTCLRPQGQIKLSFAWTRTEVVWLRNSGSHYYTTPCLEPLCKKRRADVQRPRSFHVGSYPATGERASCGLSVFLWWKFSHPSFTSFGSEFFSNPTHLCSKFIQLVLLYSISWFLQWWLQWKSKFLSLTFKTLWAVLSQSCHISHCLSSFAQSTRQTIGKGSQPVSLLSTYFLMMHC